MPLKSYGQVLTFMRPMQVYRHARESEGYVAGGITAKWWSRKFWTFSVWEDSDAMLHFDRLARAKRGSKRTQWGAGRGCRERRRVGCRRCPLSGA